MGNADCCAGMECQGCRGASARHAASKLSMVRDGYAAGPAPVFRSSDEFVVFIKRLNREGVSVYRRLSQTVLIWLMEIVSHESVEFHQALDPMAEAAFSVSWAGQDRSPNWFDTARELTERWHHQQQIRMATNRHGIMTRELYYPVLDCFMRALPVTYRNQSGEAGTHLTFNMSGECGGSWYLYRDGDRWVQVEAPEGRQLLETTIPQEIAWRIFTKGIDREAAAAQVSVTGDRDLGAHVLSMVSIVG